MAFALQHVDALWEELTEVKMSWSFLALSVGVVFFTFVTQAGITKTLVGATASKIPLAQAIYLNNLAGFWGLVMPFGSMGYKAQQLKSLYQVPLKEYGSLFVISLMASMWVSSLILVLGFGVMAEPILPTVVFVGAGLIAFGGLFYPIWSRVLLDKIGQSHAAVARLNWWKLSAWHAFGLANYVLLYACCFAGLGFELPWGYLMVWVAIQSFLFLAPIVPGNLVVMETLGALLLASADNSAESIVLGIAIMRLSCLLGLILLAPVSFYLKKSE